MNACYILYFRLHYLPYYAKTRTSNFRKVVWQHTEGMVLSVISILFKIYFPLHRNNETILAFRYRRIKEIYTTYRNNIGGIRLSRYFGHLFL